LHRKGKSKSNKTKGPVVNADDEAELVVVDLKDNEPSAKENESIDQGAAGNKNMMENDGEVEVKVKVLDPDHSVYVTQLEKLDHFSIFPYQLHPKGRELKAIRAKNKGILLISNLVKSIGSKCLHPRPFFGKVVALEYSSHCSDRRGEHGVRATKVLPPSTVYHYFSALLCGNPQLPHEVSFFFVPSFMPAVKLWLAWVER